MDLRKLYFLVVIFFTAIGVFLLSQVAYSDPDKSFAFLQPTIGISQVHIAFGADPHSINIAWILKHRADLCYLVFQRSSLYGVDDTYVNYDAPSGGFYESWVYNVTVSELEPGETYAYHVECSSDGVLTKSRDYEFVGPPRKTSPIRVISIADLSTGKESDPFDNYTNHPKPNILPFLKNLTNSKEFDALIHAGDFAYDLSSFDGRMGDEFMKSIEPIAARLPYMPTTGNHESYTNFTHYRGVFKTPGPNTYYSFNLGLAHFVMLDSEAYVGRFHTDLQLAQHQAWLEDDLRQNQLPWVIAVAHRPIYCNPNPKCKVCTNSCTKYCLVMAEYLEELYIQYKVALHVSADVHLYERTKPVYKNRTMQEGTDVYHNPPAPIYIVNGVAGNFDRDDSMTTMAEKLQPWAVRISDSLGYGLLTVHNRTHLQWEQYAVGETQNDDMEWLVRQTPRKIDEFWIVRDQ